MRKSDKTMAQAPAMEMASKTSEDVLSVKALPQKPNVATISITLTDDAAIELAELSRETGLAVGSLIETSLGLLRSTVKAQREGNRVVLTSRRWWPIREFFIPKPS